MMRKILLFLFLAIISIDAFASVATTNLNAYRWRNNDNNETAATWKAAQNSVATITTGDPLRLRIEMTNTGTASYTQGGSLEYSQDGVTWIAVGITDATDFKFVTSTHVTHNANTTAQITGGTLTYSAGKIVSNTAPAISFSVASSRRTELEYVIQPTINIDSNSVYYFRTTANNYLITPQLNTNILCPGAPAIVMGSSIDICQGSDVQLTVAASASGNTFSWTGPDGFTSSEQNPLLVAPGAIKSGTYTLVATNTSTGCTNIGTMFVRIRPLPPAFAITPSSSNICPGGTVDLHAPIAVISNAYTEHFEVLPIPYTTSGVGITASQNTTYFAEGSASLRLQYANNANAFHTINTNINLTSCPTATLKFKHIAALEGYLETYDRGFVEYSSDGGTTWHTFGSSEYAGSGTLISGNSFSTLSYPSWVSNITGESSLPNNSLWQEETFNIPVAALTDRFKIRFKITSDGSLIYYGWLIDDVRILNNDNVVYAWSPSSGTASGSHNETYAAFPTPTSASSATTTYTATATNLLGCSATNTATVTVSPIPSGIFGISPSTCGGTNASITIAGLLPTTEYTMTYTKDGGTPITSSIVLTNTSGNLMIGGLTAGVYTSIYVTHVGTGCSSNTPLTRTINDPISPALSISSFSSPTTCGHNNGFITFTVPTTGNFTLHYKKDGTDHTVLLGTVSSGSYTLSGLTEAAYTHIYIVNNTSMCQSPQLNQTLTDPLPPVITLIATNNTATCGGNEGSIDFTGLNPSENYTIDYELDGGYETTGGTADASGNFSLNGLEAGEYLNIIITNEASCASESFNQTIADPLPPVVTIASFSNTTSCGGNEGVINFAGLTAEEMYTINYDFDGSAVTASGITDLSGNFILSSLAAGDYTNIVITNAANCMSSALSQTIVNPVPPTISITGFTNPSICGANDGSISFAGLDEEADYTLTYEFGGITESLAIESSVAGTYELNGLSSGDYEQITLIPINSCNVLIGAQTLTDPSQNPLSITPIYAASCNGDIHSLSVTGGHVAGTVPTILWAPIAGLYADAAATIPYAGENVSTVYAKPSSSATYIATATVGSCWVNISVDIDIREADNNAALSTAAQNGVALVVACESEGWTYYTSPTDLDQAFLFGINWGSGNEDAKAVAIPTIQLDGTSFASEDAGAMKGTYTMNRYWNVDLGGTVLVNPVSVRFFYDVAEKNNLDAQALDFATMTGGLLETPMWFKMESVAFLPAASIINPIQVDNAIPLIDVSGGATLNGVAYAQFDGIESFSGGTYAAGVGDGAPLNTILDKIEAVANGATNKVIWNTLSEELGYSFQLEKSIDGRSFNVLTKMDANGYPSQYFYLDQNPANGYNYYRVMLMSNSGYQEYSKIVFVNIDKDINNVLTVFPNPADKDVTLRIQGRVGNNAKITITDVTGKVIKVMNEIQSNEIKVSLEDYAQGIYLIKYSDDHFHHSVKVTKQ